MPWQLAAAAAGALGSLGSTILGNRSNSNLNRTNRQWQTSERLAQQDWQNRQRVSQNDFAERMYNQYSSPAALKQQYLDAGFNPGLAVDNGSVGNVSAQSGTSGSAPSGQSPAFAPMQMYDFGGQFQNMASALKSLGEAKKLGIDLKYYEQQIKEAIRSQQLANAAQEFLNSFNNKWMDKEKALQVQKLAQDIESGELSQQELRKRIEMLGKELHLKDNEINTWFERFNKEMSNLESSTNVNNANASIAPSTISKNDAEARQANANADTNIASQPYVISRLELDNMSSEQEFYSSIYKNVIRSYYGSDDIPNDIFNRGLSYVEGFITGGRDDRSRALNFIKYLSDSKDREQFLYRLGHPNDFGSGYSEFKDNTPLELKGGQKFIPLDDGGFRVLYSDGSSKVWRPVRKRK